MSVDRLYRVSENFYAFHCPGCGGGHGIPVNGNRTEAGAGWGWNGSLEKPTFNPSILVNVGGANPDAPVCHSFVRDGQIMFLTDSTHALSGQTVDIPGWES